MNKQQEDDVDVQVRQRSNKAACTMVPAGEQSMSSHYDVMSRIHVVTCHVPVHEIPGSLYDVPVSVCTPY